jgi:hypothetical protein
MYSMLYISFFILFDLSCWLLGYLATNFIPRIMRGVKTSNNIKNQLFLYTLSDAL